jgi:hypothetical protein
MEDWKDCSTEVTTAKSDVAMEIQRYADHCLKIGLSNNFVAGLHVAADIVLNGLPKAEVPYQEPMWATEPHSAP